MNQIPLSLQESGINLMEWKKKKGDNATFENLIKAFEGAGHQSDTDAVRRICHETS